MSLLSSHRLEFDLLTSDICVSHFPLFFFSFFFFSSLFSFFLFFFLLFATRGRPRRTPRIRRTIIALRDPGPPIQGSFGAIPIPVGCLTPVFWGSCSPGFGATQSPLKEESWWQNSGRPKRQGGPVAPAAATQRSASTAIRERECVCACLP